MFRLAVNAQKVCAQNNTENSWTFKPLCSQQAVLHSLQSKLPQSRSADYLSNFFVPESFNLLWIHIFPIHACNKQTFHPRTRQIHCATVVTPLGTISLYHALVSIHRGYRKLVQVVQRRFTTCLTHRYSERGTLKSQVGALHGQTENQKRQFGVAYNHIMLHYFMYGNEPVDRELSSVTKVASGFGIPSSDLFGNRLSIHLTTDAYLSPYKLYT